FKITGVIMDESPTGCWTNHHSIIQFDKQWYLFYHHNDYSPKFDKSRSIRLDSLSFNGDGTIRKVIPTLRGVGVTPADKPIQLDRYTSISSHGAAIDLLDSASTFKGWKTNLSETGAWVRYNQVDFKNKFKAVNVRAQSSTGGILQLRTGGLNGPVIAEVTIAAGKEWSNAKASLSKIRPGLYDIVAVLKKEGAIQVDWISFE
ncbi:MAG TPA: carbohydrate-binding protein, partial [Ohtaekwangia sp.]